MVNALSANVPEIMESLYNHPSISVVMKFDPKMQSKTELGDKLKMTVNNVAKHLKENYPSGLSLFMINRLKTIIEKLNYSTHTKSLAIFLTPVFQKILYLDLPVGEKIIIDEPFTMRDIVLSKDRDPEYLLLHFGATNASVHLFADHRFSKILSDGTESHVEVLNNMPDNSKSISNASDGKQTILNKFLDRVDHSIHLILNAYDLPLFVLASDKICSRFKKLTKHDDRIIQYIGAHIDEVSSASLNGIMQPYNETWKKQKQIYLFKSVRAAANAKKLASGLTEVWKDSMQSRGKILLLESNFSYRTPYGSVSNVVHMPYALYDSRTHIRDVADEVIQKVLENGGSVEFVEPELLKTYAHIALIKYH